MRKHIAKCEINWIILTFDKFITNAHKKEKKLRFRNYNIFVNANWNVKCCSNDEKWVWDLYINTRFWYKAKFKILEFFKEQRRFKQRFDIEHHFCNDENVYEVDFRIQMFACNDDKYERRIWNRCSMMHFAMQSWLKKNACEELNATRCVNSNK